MAEPIKTADELIKRIIRAIQGKEEFILNATFVDEGVAHAVFLAGSQLSKAVLDTQDQNHQLVLNHLRGYESIQKSARRINAEALKNVSIEKSERTTDGGIILTFKNKGNDQAQPA